MLVLSRKAAESIVIDERIEIKILGVCGGRVRLGVLAPNEVHVRRLELEKRQERDAEIVECRGV